MTTKPDKVIFFRRAMARAKLDGLLIGRGDAFAGEEVQPAEERLAWLTGFTGSAGLALVTQEAALLFSDGRYKTQMAKETSAAWQCIDAGDKGLWSAAAAWLKDNKISTGQGRDQARLGLDAWRTTQNAYGVLTKTLAKQPISLVLLTQTPIDAFWLDRPPPHISQAWDVAAKQHGMSRHAKIAQLCDAMKTHKVDAVLISNPCDLAWLLNIRASDLTHTPVLLAFGLVLRDGAVTIFHPDAKTALANINRQAITSKPLAGMGEVLTALAKDGKRLWLDPASCPAIIHNWLAASTAKPLSQASPLALPKAQKNATEQNGFRACHRRDGVAVMRLLHWLQRQNPLPSEVAAAQRMTELRAEMDGYICDSFPAISASGSNGAIIHYRASEAEGRQIERGNLYLLDSGGHYADGSTDITRTIYMQAGGDSHKGDKPPPQHIHAYTHVLKAHIALASHSFPAGTRGAKLDGVARNPMLQVGLDYPHGTGHGVGHCLGVHEVPPTISKRSKHVLVPGAVVSNEPGYYVAGEFGIRLENLLLVVEKAKTGNNKAKTMLGFEVLTQVPFDRRLIDSSLLTAHERAWLNAYHAGIAKQFMPLLAKYERGADKGISDWLAKVTAPI